MSLKKRKSREPALRVLLFSIMPSLITTPVCGNALDTIDGFGAESEDVKNSSIA
jgi:hypothetical protein